MTDCLPPGFDPYADRRRRVACPQCAASGGDGWLMVEICGANRDVMCSEIGCSFRVIMTPTGPIDPTRKLFTRSSWKHPNHETAAPVGRNENQKEFQFKEQPVMPRTPKTKTGCECTDCTLDAKTRGMCHAHYQRWAVGGKPDLAKFKAGGGGGPVGDRGRRNGTSKAACNPSRNSVPDEKPTAAATPAPRAAESQGGQDAPALPGFRTIPIPSGATALHIGILGEHLTVTDTHGKVIDQFPFEE